MRTVTICSFAKLNLTFEILDTLPGGYHQVRTVFQSVDLADQLDFTLVETGADEPFSVELISSAPSDFPLDDSNLITKAAKTFEAMSSCGTGTKLSVSVEKKIPIAAGMAGGSGNAAAALRAMEYFFPSDCSSSDADLIASQLGSDINFCLHGGTQVGTNRGELLHPLNNSNELTFLIVKPRDISISTPWIFRKYDERPGASPAVSNHNYTEELCDALAAGSLSSVSSKFFNAFEDVCFDAYPAVKRLRDNMLHVGCMSANITGSGPTLFGVVTDLEDGLKVQERLSEHYRLEDAPEDFDSWVTQTTSAGLLVLE